MALTFEYRLDGGSAQPLADTSPATIDGLIAETSYDLEVRAVKHGVAGAWSTVWTFTTTAAVIPARWAMGTLTAPSGGGTLTAVQGPATEEITP